MLRASAANLARTMSSGNTPAGPRCGGCSVYRALGCGQFSTSAAAGGSSGHTGLNKYSRNITKPKDQGASQVRCHLAVACLGVCDVYADVRTLELTSPGLAARSLGRYDAARRCCSDKQAMLYATEGIEKDSDLEKPMIGVASVW